MFRRTHSQDDILISQSFAEMPPVRGLNYIPDRYAIFVYEQVEGRLETVLFVLIFILNLRKDKTFTYYLHYVYTDTLLDPGTGRTTVLFSVCIHTHCKRADNI